MKNGRPYKAFSGSANYTLRSFSKECGELMIACDKNEALAYYDTVEARSINCNSNEVENYIRIHKHSPNYNYERLQIDTTSDAVQKLSLVSKNGEVPKSSGLNWGQRPNRNPNQAYIPLPSQIARTGFFPLNKRPFTVIADDGWCAVMRVEQDNDKAITTPGNNAELGEYLRGRLGLDAGELVTVEHLNAHGRQDIEFTKLDDEHFMMNFSSPNANEDM